MALQTIFYHTKYKPAIPIVKISVLAKIFITITQ